MRCTLLKFLLTAFVVGILMSFSSYDACDYQFGYTVRGEGAGSSKYVVEVFLKKGSYDTYNFVLYDLNAGSVVEQKAVRVTSNTEKIQFKVTNPSLYEVFIKTNGCKRGVGVGGNDGIKVGIEN
jgi:hypothetical protein